MHVGSFAWSLHEPGCSEILAVERLLRSRGDFSSCVFKSVQPGIQWFGGNNSTRIFGSKITWQPCSRRLLQRPPQDARPQGHKTWHRARGHPQVQYFRVHGCTNPEFAAHNRQNLTPQPCATPWGTPKGRDAPEIAASSRWRAHKSPNRSLAPPGARQTAAAGLFAAGRARQAQGRPRARSVQKGGDGARESEFGPRRCCGAAPRSCLPRWAGRHPPARPPRACHPRSVPLPQRRGGAGRAQRERDAPELAGGGRPRVRKSPNRSLAPPGATQTAAAGLFAPGRARQAQGRPRTMSVEKSRDGARESEFGPRRCCGAAPRPCLPRWASRHPPSRAPRARHARSVSFPQWRGGQDEHKGSVTAPPGARSRATAAQAAGRGCGRGGTGAVTAPAGPVSPVTPPQPPHPACAVCNR
jgi:hypothetical protein